MKQTITIAPAAYAGWYGSALGAITEYLEDALLVELLGDVRGQRVLDVGCGMGRLATQFARAGADVTGVDADPAMIARAVADSTGLDRRARLAAAMGEQLPFADGTFDAVLAKTVLCFVPDGTGMVNEIARVLRPGGRFVIGELGKWSSWAALRRLRAWLGADLWRQGRFRTPSELRALATSAGLDVRALRGAVYYPRCAVAAKLMAPVDAWLGRRTTFGAAFLALSADKPVTARA